MKERTCPRCSVTKSHNFFYSSGVTKTGVDVYCKVCRRQYQQGRRLKISHYMNTRYANDPEYRARVLTKNKKHRTKKKNAANDAVAYALKKERLVRQPCEQCGEKKAIAHHEDYDKPLDVVWLCRPCHYTHHNPEKIHV